MKASFLLLGLLALGATAHARAKTKSTITFGRSESLQAKPAAKRSFKHDIAAVSKAHESWKKAHLDPMLYSCQKNGERVASLARQVADKIEAVKKDATADAKALETLVAKVMGSATEVPANLAPEKSGMLRERRKELEQARKHGDMLTRLAGQIKYFYLNDIPKQTSFGGACVAGYPVALKKGVAASRQYHADAEAMSEKLGRLTKLVQAAMGKAGTELVAGTLLP